MIAMKKAGYIPEGERFFNFEDSRKLKESFLVACRVFEDFQFIMLPTIENYQPEYYEGFGVEPFITGTTGRGEVLCLRSDWTVSLVRYLSGLRKLDLPKKVFYWGAVFSPSGSFERFQTGVEILGISHITAEAQVITKLVQYLKEMGIKEMVVSVGHTGIVRKLTETYGTDVKERLMIKDFSLTQRAPIFRELLTSEGTVQHLYKMKEVCPEWETEIGELLQLQSLLEGVPVCFDLTEVRRQDYYTGIVFEIFHPSAGSPVAGGGRYDRLFRKDHRYVPAVGGAVYLDILLDLVV